MIGLRLTVPIACWRKGQARELLETEPLPPPSTCYGALLSLVGEEDPEAHRGCRVTAGLMNEPPRSLVLRTLWQIKDRKPQQGVGSNAGPDLQQLLSQAELVLWCDSGGEHAAQTLESRVAQTLRAPATIERFGGWSLGESTHLVNDAWILAAAHPPGLCRAFLLDPDGDLTLPVWVDHVGSRGTRHAVGKMVSLDVAPPAARLPQIPLSVSDAG